MYESTRERNSCSHFYLFHFLFKQQQKPAAIEGKTTAKRENHLLIWSVFWVSEYISPLFLSRCVLIFFFKRALVYTLKELFFAEPMSSTYICTSLIIFLIHFSRYLSLFSSSLSRNMWISLSLSLLFNKIFPNVFFIIFSSWLYS
jgi:hypothetical protein